MIWQIAYDRVSKERIEAPFVLYDTEGIELHNYENDVILDIWKNRKDEWKDEEWVGVFSWRFKEKTGMSAKEVMHALSESEADMVSFNPPMYSRHEHPFVKRGFPSVLDMCKSVDSAGLFQTKLLGYRTDYVIWCNYWAARPHIFDKYCRDYLNPVVEHLKETPLYWRREAHRQKRYISTTFFLEGLPTFFAKEEEINHQRETLSQNQHNTMNYLVIEFEGLEPIITYKRRGETQKLMRQLGLKYDHKFLESQFLNETEAKKYIAKLKPQKTKKKNEITGTDISSSYDRLQRGSDISEPTVAELDEQVQAEL